MDIQVKSENHLNMVKLHISQTLPALGILFQRPVATFKVCEQILNLHNGFFDTTLKRLQSQFFLKCGVQV